jgi:hypothetical protein
MPSSRREFLYGLGAMGARSLIPTERIESELILYNANFWLVNPRQPKAQAVAISAERFLAIGSKRRDPGRPCASAPRKLRPASGFKTSNTTTPKPPIIARSPATTSTAFPTIPYSSSIAVDTRPG